MSQCEVLRWLADAGGRARRSALMPLAAEKYPTLDPGHYVGKRLSKLKVAGMIGYDAATHEYYIISDYLLHNRNIVK